MITSLLCIPFTWYLGVWMIWDRQIRESTIRVQSHNVHWQYHLLRRITVRIAWDAASEWNIPFYRTCFRKHSDSMPGRLHMVLKRGESLNKNLITQSAAFCLSTFWENHLKWLFLVEISWKMYWGLMFLAVNIVIIILTETIPSFVLWQLERCSQ